MTDGRRAARRRTCRAAVWIAASVVACPLWAESSVEVPTPSGFPAGWLYLAPSITAGYSYNSNVFLNARNEQVADRVLTMQPSVELTVPFSNSSIRLKDTLNWIQYKKTQQPGGRAANDANLDFTLRFGSMDTLDASLRHVTGVSETSVFDPGQGVATTQGNSYQFNTETVSVTREIEGARGYRFTLSRNTLHFDRSVAIFFFTYRGFDGEAAYVQPLSPNTRLVFGYLGSRYDHFNINIGLDPYTPFRKERGDTVYAEFGGRLGPKQPYSVRAGWERLAFDNGAAITTKNYSGLILDSRLSAIVGGGTSFTLIAKRQPYRSFFLDDNYYVFDQVGCQINRGFPRGSAVGGELSLVRNSYPELSDASSATGSPTPLYVYRRDRGLRYEAYANLAISDRLFFRLAVLRDRRKSSYPNADYSSTIIFGGMVFGWI